MESNNLLNFVINATSNIKEALDKPPKGRRNVTVKKFAEKRVKRLEGNRKPRTGSLTKTTFGPRKTIPLARPQASNTVAQYTNLLKHSNTWPEIEASPAVPALPVQTAGMSTCAYPTTCTASPSVFSTSEPNLSLPFQPSPQPSQTIDPELESLLSEFECQSAPLSRCGSFESTRTGNSSCTPPLNTLEAQMYMAEQALSPYSDYSDELDSAYCSPVESARVSCNCSPTNLGTTLPDWSSADLLPPVTSSCLQEVGMVSSACDWVSCGPSPLTTSTTTSVSSVYDQCPPMASVPSVYDQGPPMTPTVSQLLEQYTPYC